MSSFTDQLSINEGLLQIGELNDTKSKYKFKFEKTPEKVKKQKEKKPQTLADLLQYRMTRLEQREARLIKAIENHKKNQKLQPFGEN
jgi:hypothetical protein